LLFVCFASRNSNKKTNIQIGNIWPSNEILYSKQKIGNYSPLQRGPTLLAYSD